MASGVLDYSDIYQEVRGALHEGRIRLSQNSIVFKNLKTGKVETIQVADIENAFWRRVARGYELKLDLTDGRCLKYDGFPENDFEKIGRHVKNNYKVTLEEQELCAKGWNWGETTFNGYELQFDVDDMRAFEIPLQNVSQCTPGKNEVSLEFHQNDDAELSLMEMRFFVPPSQNDETDTVQVFSENVISKADVLQAKGNAICTFQDLQCLTPRGRYDIRMYPKFVQLHGKTFDYKITYTSILRLFLLPHRDQRQIFFVVSLDPPVRQGQTRYHFLVLLFYKEDEISVEMTLSEREIADKFGDRLQKDMSGPIYEVVSRVMKNLVQRKITVPGSFKGPNSEQCIMCAYKASSGFLFPLERGFMYVHKPPIHVRFDEIAFVNFARGSAASSRSFDFEIETRSQTSYTFSNIEKNCYPSLFDFVQQKKLKIKNIGKGKEGGANMDFMASDSEDEQHDAYLEMMKQEAADRDDDDDGGSDRESEDDEDFNPGAEPSGEVRDEFDSDAGNTSSEEEGKSGSGSSSEEEKPKKKLKKKEKPAPQKRKREKEGRKSTKKKKDPSAPKRPTSAYMQWLSDNRSKIKSSNPGLSITEIAKEGGRLWKEVDDDEKQIYQKKYEKAKIRYAEEMKKYKAEGGSTSKSVSPKKSKPTGKAKIKSPSKAGTFKSAEFIQDSGSSSSSDSDSPKAKVKKESSPSPEASKGSASEPSASESEAESSAASSGDDSD